MCNKKVLSNILAEERFLPFLSLDIKHLTKNDYHVNDQKVNLFSIFSLNFVLVGKQNAIWKLPTILYGLCIFLGLKIIIKNTESTAKFGVFHWPHKNLRTIVNLPKFNLN